eukprot:gb/GECG01009801.1/.p1 GENE.gb/GECG01009801.1/~~gb/GECG01009801.1/.p1  ORF type:complete len:549 (+),score=50.16 gb/GECG01009801.1/:1-1647(+)
MPNDNVCPTKREEPSLLVVVSVVTVVILVILAAIIIYFCASKWKISPVIPWDERDRVSVTNPRAQHWLTSIDDVNYLPRNSVAKGADDTWSTSLCFELNKLLCNDNQIKYEGKRLYETMAHEEMVTFLQMHAGVLNEGYFKDKDGVQSRLLIGPRGIGKSTTLREFTRLCALIYPAIIPIYISFERIRYSRKLQETELDDLLIELLTKTGIDFGSDINQSEDKMFAIANTLKDNGKYCFLLLDELDEVYSLEDSIANKGTSLSALRCLATDHTGSFYTVLCGSSANLPHLITGNIEKELKREYPQLKHVGPLNGTKFEERRIRPSYFGETKALESIMHGCTEQERKLTAFFVGVFPRQVEKMAIILKKLRKSSSNADVARVENELCDFLAPIDKRDAANNTWEQTRAAMSKILRKMYAQNEVLFKNVLTKENKLDFDVIWKRDWSRWKPIQTETIQKKLNIARTALRRLQDRNWLVPGSRYGGETQEFYPAAPYHVLVYGNTNHTNTDVYHKEVVKKTVWARLSVNLPGVGGVSAGWEHTSEGNNSRA